MFKKCVSLHLHIYSSAFIDFFFLLWLRTQQLGALEVTQRPFGLEVLDSTTGDSGVTGVTRWLGTLHMTLTLWLVTQNMTQTM